MHAYVHLNVLESIYMIICDYDFVHDLVDNVDVMYDARPVEAIILTSQGAASSYLFFT